MSLNLEQASAATFAVQSAATAQISGLTGAATTYTVANIPFVLNGAAGFKATAAGAATPTTDGNTGAAITLTANKARAVVWALNAAGTVLVYAGPIVDWVDTTANSTACPLPSLPGNVVPIAVHTLQGGPTLSGTWTFGSSNWNATGIVIDAVVNLFSLPDSAIFTA